jgi:hypothetical protein
VDEVGLSLRLTRPFGRDSSRTRCQQIRPTQRGRNLLVSLVVAIGCEGVIAHNVTLGADDSKKFLEFTQTKVIPSLDRQRFNPHGQCPVSQDLVKTQQAFEDVGLICHHIVHFSMMQNGYLDSS